MTHNRHSKGAPLNFLLPLYPGFQLLDATGPLDILNLLSLQPEAPSITLKFIAETLDPVPVKPKPPQTAEWKFDLAAHYADPSKVNLTFNQYIQPDTTYSEYLAATKDQSSNVMGVDVLLIPGGIGSRLERVYPNGQRVRNVESLLAFIQQITPHIRHSIITVCTGSHILSDSGLLNGRRATTNMSRFDMVAASNPKVKWQTAARWVRSVPSEIEGDSGRLAGDLEIWTSAGISAGMDVTLAFISEYFGGAEMARKLARALEYDWREIGEGDRDPFYEKHH